ncbi:TolC family protein, partial [candidate division KSB1 bacterium]|nr:TolC family protein [candidate division KSB1 bacterium]
MMDLKFIIPVLFFSLQSYASATADEAILDAYIQEGVKNNLALKQKRFQYEQANSSLDEAKRMFLPSISIEARYSRAGGGREIEFPVGDLMNPVYSTLNQLLAAHGDPSTPFPQLQNEVIPFLREKEHETKIRTVLPLLQPALVYNYSIKNALTEVYAAAMESYKNTLVAEIKNAYYKYLQTNQMVQLFEDTRSLLDENIRVSQVLFDNQMVTMDVVYRARAEKLDIDQRLSDAQKKNTLAQAYFNFLLNRPLQENIKVSESDYINQNLAISPEKAEQMALQNRQE